MDTNANQGSLRQIIGRLAYSISLTVGSVVLLASPAAGAPPKVEPVPLPTEDVIIDAGTACPNFDLRIHFEGDRIIRTFYDRNGREVRMISAGKGLIETFTNETTGASVTFNTGGSVSRTTPNPNGTYTLTLTGHNIVIFFPTDQPPGPRSTLYLGRLVLTITDPISNTIIDIQQPSGKQVDICAILAV
jgi:hypothetical protein